ncbi:PREDICTED: interleukin-21 receptor [Gekko japonicus]|uniref:Interleukin-21 receptor n=1 Tax=Gekko japonicus TaxID=146911 RepID=A0ABM1JK45_GEKJA|nr:PREDICTED: interleukin-21 receptor [Gekko japonicus]
MRGQALLLLLFLQHSRSDSACKDLRCFADYIRTLTCMWDTGPGHPRGRLHNLTATWGCGHGCTCAFLPTFRNASHLRYACSSEQRPCFSRDTFAVRVTMLVGGAPPAHQDCGPFRCHENVKPPPPSKVTAVAHPDGYNVSWESGYAAYDYLHGEMQYQLRYRQKGHPWNAEGGTAGAPKPVLQDTPTLWLLPQELKGGAEYELQVRAGPRDHSLYKGTWSDWGPAGRLRTPPRVQKWAGTSCSGATLDVYEPGTALPEVARISPRPPLSAATLEETSAPHCTATLPALAEESDGSVLEPAYGHLSIDTVTVADACGLELEDYRCLPLDDGGSTERLLPARQIPPPPRDFWDSGSSGPWRRDTCLAQLQAGTLPEHRNTLDGEPTRGGPVSASSPPSTQPLCRKPLSPIWAADGDPGDGLDLDTVDSGFADSDCGSPVVDCEFRGMHPGCTAPGEEEEGTTFLPSYVKQWVACHLPPAEHT